MANKVPKETIRKTRLSSGSQLREYLGSGRHLLPSEVPTLRACLRQAIILQKEKVLGSEVDKRNYTLKT